MNSTQVEASFKYQTSRHVPRVSFRKGTKLVFRRRLANDNRAMVWVHKDRHGEIAMLADATGIPMANITDALLRFALGQMVVVDDEGRDVELRKYMDDVMGVQEVESESQESESSPAHSE